ncbi:PQ-loop-domain-containing protein [Basidiobolus meristosporus CBS 931.73]|uniref:PQ-loop-domain-containing protein n=1 Tax=Basidiobolus meristosporus CBS 931.73 TaxID=1314790 RepID=A0A1Y1Z9V0_9FUNG|nr:PQ-loop-domain-containing protein [Basidiobolus meristosporus CBS 931.73]|eukprot:ORY06565.1 PQ-loop-domain-containing protein [Basidiobolus meristosporus CBS 931.73]
MRVLLNNLWLSQICGYASLCFWVVVFTPQLYENWKRKNSSSLSLTFVTIWIAGDVFNLIGAYLQQLLPTMLFLAFYYSLADVVLLFQVIYYRRNDPYEDEEQSALIHSSHDSYHSTTSSTEAISRRRTVNWAYLFLAIFCLVGLGIVGSKYRHSTDNRNHGHPIAKELLFPNGIVNFPVEGEIALVPQIFGWISAFLYVGARIPQIWKNYQDKSCDGLSWIMFALCVLGNLSYVGSILFHSTESWYILKNLAWLVGSGGTLFFDFVIFYQFWLYRGIKRNADGYSVFSTNESTLSV